MLNRDRNLLFGVFAVQLKRISASKIMTAAGAWASEPDKSLAEYLVKLDVINDDGKELLERFVNEAIEANGGDSGKTLAAFGGEDVVAQTFAGSIRLTESGGLETTYAGDPETNGRFRRF